MDIWYRNVLKIAVWLGFVAFLIGVIQVLVQPDAKFLFLLPRGWLNGAQTLFLAAIAVYCLIKIRAG